MIEEETLPCSFSDNHASTCTRERRLLRNMKRAPSKARSAALPIAIAAMVPTPRPERIWLVESLEAAEDVMEGLDGITERLLVGLLVAMVG